MLSYALYPKVYEDYCEHFQAYNDVSKLESHVYFYGLRPGEETTIQIEEGNDTLIKFVGKSEPDEKGYRILQFEVNGFLREVKILDKHFEVKADRRLKTDPKNPGHLGATLPGTICDIRIKEGDRVTKNMPLMVIEAMKMETTVISKVNGTVDKIYVKDGEEVNEDTLLVSFIIDMEEQPEEVHPELPEMDFTTLEKDEFKTVDVTEEENKSNLEVLMEREHITPQGVSVFHDKNENIHSFCLCLYVRAGSLFETKENNGISHFFEHIVFKNIHYQMGENLYQTLDRCGLDFNASTYEEFIQFIITGAPAHFEEAAEILTGIFEPITLPEEVIDTERTRIKAEIREEDEESSLGYFTKKIAWKNTSLERTITGKKKTLDKIKGKQLRKFQKEVLSSNNIFFYISGNYPETAVVTVTKLMEN